MNERRCMPKGKFDRTTMKKHSDRGKGQFLPILERDMEESSFLSQIIQEVKKDKNYWKDLVKKKYE
jgi:hypothetical protein